MKNIAVTTTCTALIALAMPCAAEDTPRKYETTFSGYVSTELTFSAALADEKLQRQALERMFRDAKSMADEHALMELSARIDNHIEQLGALTFEDVFPPRTRVTNKFSLIVSVDAGRGETLYNISREVDDFVSSIPITAAEHIETGGRFYITGCGEASAINTHIIN